MYKAASNLGYQSHFYKRRVTSATITAHVKAGVPAVDIIDLDYGYSNAIMHTPQDTIDKLSPESLAISGDVVLETIRLINAHY